MSPPLDMGGRLRVAVALAMAAGAFCTAGWMAMAPPDDPSGALTLIGHAARVRALVLGLALTIVVAALAEILVGIRLPHFGLFAAAFGLTALRLRGRNMADLLIESHLRPDRNSSDLYTALAFETAVWAVVLGAGFVTSISVVRWLRNSDRRIGNGGGEVAPTGSGPRVDGSGSAGRHGELPDVRGWLGGALQGVPAMLTAATIALLVIRMTVAGSPIEPVRSGQVLFSICLGYFAGAWIAGHLFPKAPFSWLLFAVPVASIGGYVLAATAAGFTGILSPYNAVVVIPPSPFARALPLEQIAVGVQAIFLASWIAPRPMTSELEDRA